MVKHRVTAVWFAALLMLVSASLIHAQRSSRQAATGLPTPRSTLGFAPGDDRTIADWRQITDYFARLDKASDRVLVREIGRSTLQRPIIAAFISARENILTLSTYQEIQRKLADPRVVQTVAERDRLISSGKVVVAISCSIHSTEIVASQMSMQLAYELASAKDPATLEILQNTIVILIPSSNPDGIDIVANWYRKTLGTAYEGKEPPEIYHHYAGHDDNRDWFMLNLKETQAITRLFWKEWFPQIVYDIHQQGPNGSRFFISAVLRSTKPKHPAVIVAPGWSARTQDGGRSAGCRRERRDHELNVRHLVARRLSHGALLPQFDWPALRGCKCEVDDPDCCHSRPVERRHKRAGCATRWKLRPTFPIPGWAVTGVRETS
jgi:hypothetical protein